MNKQKHSKKEIISAVKIKKTILSSRKPKKSKPAFDHWLKKNKYYHKNIVKFYKFVVPEQSRVLHVNCKNGYVLDALNPIVGVGIDDDADALETAKQRHEGFQFFSDLRSVPEQTFDYIILTSVTMEEYDIQDQFCRLRPFCTSSTRIVVDSYSYLWEPILRVTQRLKLRRPTNFKNWISHKDLHSFLHLADFQAVTTYRHTLLPKYIPLLSWFFNTVLIHVPLVCRFCLHHIAVARPSYAESVVNPEPVEGADRTPKGYLVSVIIPCKNEKGNVEAAVRRCPQMGKKTEIIFVEGGSQDGTLQEIERVAKKYPEKNIRFFAQDGKGKGNAVRKGFVHATGDILMILDADLTVPPEELPKFAQALVDGKGELINGSRLVYGMESGAMRFLNVLANFFFSVLFSWLLNQRVKDTLCGTKVLFKKDYEKIASNRHYFGNFDPFGDFDLLFGAAKLNFKIIDMPVHYKSRTYGSTQIRRFLHGWILLGMSFLAMRKLKFR